MSLPKQDFLQSQQADPPLFKVGEPSGETLRHVLFLFSDTGGGHRSASEAIIEAINLEFPNRISTEMVDFFKEYAPPPFNLAPQSYPPMSRMPDVWEFSYRISDGRRRIRAFFNLMWPYVRRASYRLLSEHPCDLIVSVHPIVNTPVLRALAAEPKKVPYITVVTDMVSTHVLWFNRKADLVLVPTEQALVHALESGLKREQVQVVGLPVADRFCQSPGDRRMLRARLGWPQDYPVVVLVGGGEGMGPLQKTALAIGASGLKVALVVIAGRNRGLKASLEAVNWHIPTYIYGFVREMPDFMRAADVLVTKAGPGTISESFIAGLPIILYSKMPGQEDGNVDYVVEQGAGVWAPQPELVVDTLRRWIEHPEERDQVAKACRSLAKPDAARQIARIIAQKLAIPPNPKSVP